jgi:outer membrane protein OmpA-like peptidoglycan-associated protein
MTHRILVGLLVMGLGVAFESGCATKKYVRNRVAERVEPLENRTSELEETSRRNSQQIGDLNNGLADARTRVARAQDTADRAAQSAEQANTRVATVENSVEDIRANLDKYTIQTTSMVFFRPGSARLTAEAMAQLDQLASQITDRNGFIFEITGFGDTVRATRYNQNLAQMRAEAVERYLADKDSVPVMRMFALGFGSTRPITQNVSNTGESNPPASGRALSRRVEIKLLTHNISKNASMGGPGPADSGSSDSTRDNTRPAKPQL